MDTPRLGREMFRRVYPFSPALVNVLVALSSVLQRERTALRVMLQLLVEQRDVLEVGKLIAVGDLFDVIADDNTPFSDGLRRHFEDVQKLWRDKLRPMLEAIHGIDSTAIEGASAWEDPKARAFRAEARLVKTLLLASLVPEADSFRALTASRLHALNHGTIETPIPGRETQDVVARARHWATRAGEVRIGEGGDPTIAIHVSGVDIEPILAKAMTEDTDAERRRRIRETLYRKIGITHTGLADAQYDWEWRGSKRVVDVVFGNVRELAVETFRNPGEVWRIVLDFPFDEPQYTPRDDIARLDKFQSTEALGRTVCWLPSFFSREMMTDLGKLVLLDRILPEERYRGFTDHLSAVARQQARLVLENLRSQLDHKLGDTLEAAYGLRRAEPGVLDEELSESERLRSLDPTFRPRPPVGANLKAGFEHVLDQMLTHQYPAHPQFDRTVKLADLRKVCDAAIQTAATPDQRSTPDSVVRPLLRQIAAPLGLGEQHETAFLLKDRWKTQFLKKAAAAGPPLTVAKLRGAIDEPSPMGLQREVQNLLILVFAAQTGKSFAGSPHDEPSLESIDDHLELRDQRIPSPGDWSGASDRASRLFGIVISPLRNAQNAAAAAKELADRCGALRPAARGLRDQLGARARSLDVPDDAPRLRAAAEGLRLVEAVLAARDEERVEVLARVELNEPFEAVGKSLASAGSSVLPTLTDNQWEFIPALESIADRRRDAALSALESLRKAFAAPEYLTALRPAFASFCAAARDLLVAGAGPHPVPEPSPSPPVPPRPPIPEPREPAAGRAQEVDEGTRTNLTAPEAKAWFASLLRSLDGAGRTLDVSWTVRETREHRPRGEGQTA